MAKGVVLALLVCCLAAVCDAGGPSKDPCDKKIWEKEAASKKDWKNEKPRKVSYYPSDVGKDPLPPKDRSLVTANSYAYCVAELLASGYNTAASKDTNHKSFCAEQIYPFLDAQSKNIKGALTYAQSHKVFSCSKNENYQIGGYCINSYNEGDLKRIITSFPACVKLTVPKSFENLKAVEEYDCSKINKKEEMISYTALAYGYDQKFYYIKTGYGNDWGKLGYLKLENAANCKITSEVSYSVAVTKV